MTGHKAGARKKVITEVVTFQVLPSVLALLLLLPLPFASGAGDPLGKVTNTTQVNDATPESPYETQTAQCTITSGEIEASAQATISKTLVGVCGTDEMLLAFRTLEAKLLQELNHIRLMIRNPNYNPPPVTLSTYAPVKRVTVASNTGSETKLPIGTQQAAQPVASVPVPTTSTQRSADIFFPSDDSEEEFSLLEKPSNSQLVKSMDRNPSTGSRIGVDEGIGKEPVKAEHPAINFQPIDKPVHNQFLTGGLRDYEVYRFNNTIINSGDSKVFKYFWRIENFTKRLRSNSTSFASPVFIISGLNLRMRAKIGYPTSDAVYLQLEQLSANDEELRKTANVILASGALYGHVETKTFFRHKIIILNQGKPFSDIISQEFLNTNTGFPIPLLTLQPENYLKDDKLLVELVIYL